MTPDLALSICRFVTDTVAMMAWGSSLYHLLLPRGEIRRPAVPGWLGSWAAVALLGAVAATLPLDAALVGNGWRDVVNWPLVADVLFKTQLGRSWRLETALAGLLALACVVPGKVQGLGTLIAAGALLIDVACSGHAATHGGWLNLAQCTIASAHVLSTAAWLGGLPCLLGDLIDRNRRGEVPQAQLALSRFSFAGHIMVAIAIATGFTNTVLEAGGVWLVPVSPYQALLAAKIGLVGLMVGLACLNRYRFTPRVAAGSTALASIRLLAGWEIALGIAIVALVSVLGRLDPS